MGPATLAFLVFGLLGGFMSTLEILIPVLFYPCPPKEAQTQPADSSGQMQVTTKDDGTSDGWSFFSCVCRFSCCCALPEMSSFLTAVLGVL